MAWTVTNEQANTLDVKSSRDTRTGTRSGTREKSSGSNTYDSGSYDVVGINGTKAKAAGDNITASCDAINAEVDKIVMNAEKLNDAVKGSELQESLKTYLTSVKSYMKAVISDVKAFADKLYEVSDAWQKSQKTFAGAVDTSKENSFGSTVSDQYKTTQSKTAGNTFSGVTEAFNSK